MFIPTFFCILLANFAILEWMPGSPLDYVDESVSATAQSGEAFAEMEMRVPQELYEQLAEQYEMHLPFAQRFRNTMHRYLTFDLGNSYATGQSVAQMILSVLPATLIVGFSAFLLIYLIGIPVGIYLSFVAFSWLDHVISVVLLTMAAMPTALLCMLYIFMFSEGWISDYFPSSSSLWGPHLYDWASFANTVWCFFLPVLTLVSASVVKIIFLVKNTAALEWKKDYVKAAISRGASRHQVLWRHILKNAVIPAVGYMSLQLRSVMVSKPFFVEMVFGFGGLSMLSFQAIQSRDYPVILGTIYVYAIMATVAQLLGDLLAIMLDRRLHFGKVAR